MCSYALWLYHLQAHFYSPLSSWRFLCWERNKDREIWLRIVSVFVNLQSLLLSCWQPPQTEFILRRLLSQPPNSKLLKHDRGYLSRSPETSSQLQRAPVDKDFASRQFFWRELTDQSSKKISNDQCTTSMHTHSAAGWGKTLWPVTTEPVHRPTPTMGKTKKIN